MPTTTFIATDNWVGKKTLVSLTIRLEMTMTLK